MQLIFKQLLIHCGIALSLVSGITHAGQATIPNNFVAGTTAKASEVNGNFNSLKAAVDDNDTRITANAAAKQFVADDANGVEIGVVFGGEVSKVSIRTVQGFVSRVWTTHGRVSPLGAAYFTDTDCGNSGGVAYLDFVGSQQGIFDEDGKVPGSVFDIVADYPSYTLPPQLWYLPKPATLLNNVQVQSVKKWDWVTSSVVCAAASVMLTTAAEIFPNDPAVTGFPNAAFPAPITIEYR